MLREFEDQILRKAVWHISCRAHGPRVHRIRAGHDIVVASKMAYTVLPSVVYTRTGP